ncbi:MAG: DUF5329 domain-containing protein [Deltaproteobacteria bacterium]|jgi:hypothetical protein|nr:DUF5329 domain-containing protein [Deltaproteobacteria bacterium]
MFRSLVVVIVSAAVMTAAFLAAPTGAAAEMSAAEAARVERFLEDLSAQSALVFIRNGREYDVERAVNHLRRKLRGAKDKITTAEEFVDQVASGSSASGKPYLIRKPGGDNEPAQPFFRELLQ